MTKQVMGRNIRRKRRRKSRRSLRSIRRRRKIKINRRSEKRIGREKR